jgi:hypothetical protein
MWTGFVLTYLLDSTSLLKTGLPREKLGNLIKKA